MATWNWLGSTRALQREAFGHNWDEIVALGDDAYAVELGRSIRSNVTALQAELGEFLQELGPQWKDWTSGPPPVLMHETRRRAVSELVDVGHFLANLLVALRVTDDEWESVYRSKQQRNRDRQAATYDGVSTKCPGCKRDLDETGMITRQDAQLGRVVSCQACGTIVGVGVGVARR